MKILIVSDHNVVSEYIRDALSELQPCTVDKYSWYKGKFYTKELYLVEQYDKKDLDVLLDQLITNGPIKNVISIGMGNPLTAHLKQGDILINDYPGGSCQGLVDRFLNNSMDEDEDIPLRIFAGTIVDKTSNEQNLSGLACLDLDCGELFSTFKAKGLSTLAVRIISGEDYQIGLDTDSVNNVVQKLLMLLKKTVEQIN